MFLLSYSIIRHVIKDMKKKQHPYAEQKSIFTSNRIYQAVLKLTLSYLSTHVRVRYLVIIAKQPL